MTGEDVGDRPHEETPEGDDTALRRAEEAIAKAKEAAGADAVPDAVEGFGGEAPEADSPAPLP